MKHNKKVILTDVDGTVLDWEYAFHVWMQDRGHERFNVEEQSYYLHNHYNVPKETIGKLVRQFNESAAIGFLPPLRDAMYYVKRLHEEHEYRFIAITSLSLDTNAQKLRKMNLHKMFGETAFTDIICLDTGADKHEVLEQYRDSNFWWFEDNSRNAEIGQELGLRSVLIEHGHTKQYSHPTIIKVRTWREIYKLITGTDA